MSRDTEIVRIQYGAYRTSRGRFAGIIKEGGRAWSNDGYVASHDLQDALAGALQAALDEGARYTGDWEVVITTAGLVNDPWGR